MFSAITHKIRGMCVWKNVHIVWLVSTNFAKTLVWKHKYDVKL